MNIDFWNKCVEKRCVVIPIKIYSNYNAESNLSECDFIGIKFTALPFSEEAIGPDYWFMLDEAQTGIEKYFTTPEEALNAFNA